VRFRIVDRMEKTFVIYDRNGDVFEEDLSDIFSFYWNWHICNVCGELLTAKTPEELDGKVASHEHDLTYIKRQPVMKFRRGLDDV